MDQLAYKSEELYKDDIKPKRKKGAIMGSVVGTTVWGAVLILPKIVPGYPIELPEDLANTDTLLYMGASFVLYPIFLTISTITGYLSPEIDKLADKTQYIVDQIPKLFSKNSL